MAEAAEPGAGVIPLAWGCTPVDGPVLRMTRAVGVGVDAPPARVWRWVCQIAVAPYSYDRLDNRGRPSPRHLVDGADHVDVGERVPVFGVTDVEPGHHWTGVTIPKVFGRTAVTYAVEPFGDGSPSCAGSSPASVVRWPGRGRDSSPGATS